MRGVPETHGEVDVARELFGEVAVGVHRDGDDSLLPHHLTDATQELLFGTIATVDVGRPVQVEVHTVEFTERGNPRDDLLNKPVERLRVDRSARTTVGAHHGQPLDVRIRNPCREVVNGEQIVPALDVEVLEFHQVRCEGRRLSAEPGDCDTHGCAFQLREYGEVERREGYARWGRTTGVRSASKSRSRGKIGRQTRSKCSRSTSRSVPPGVSAMYQLPATCAWSGKR